MLAGPPRSGKSTLVERVLPKNSQKLGLYTRKVREKDGCRGFTMVRSDGEQLLFAAEDLQGMSRVGKYGVDIEGMHAFIEPLFDKRPALHYLDEIVAVMRASNSNCCLLAFKIVIVIY